MTTTATTTAAIQSALTRQVAAKAADIADLMAAYRSTGTSMEEVDEALTGLHELVLRVDRDPGATALVLCTGGPRVELVVQDDGTPPYLEGRWWYGAGPVTLTLPILADFARLMLGDD